LIISPIKKSYLLRLKPGEGTRFSSKIAKKIGLERQFLHASKLSFTHPVTEKLMEFEDSLPPDLLKSLEKLREGEKM